MAREILAQAQSRTLILALAAIVAAYGCTRDELKPGGQVMPSNENNPSTTTRAARLIFEYEGEQVRLVSQQLVDMVVTGFDLARTHHAGVYVDARDAGGKTLTRVPARDAFVSSTEVFPERAGEAIVRIEPTKLKGAFTVVVPVPQETNKVTVVRVAPAQPDTQLPAGGATSRVVGAPEVTDIATFPLNLNK